MIPLQPELPLHEGILAQEGPWPRQPPILTHLTPTVRLDTAESPDVDAFIEAVGSRGVRRQL